MPLYALVKEMATGRLIDVLPHDPANPPVRSTSTAELARWKVEVKDLDAATYEAYRSLSRAGGGDGLNILSEDITAAKMDVDKAVTLTTADAKRALIAAAKVVAL